METAVMEGFGDRLRARAKELGLPDAEVARRLNLRQARYSNYVNNEREPDLATLVRICQVLGVSSDELLGLTSPARSGTPEDLVVQKIHAAAGAIEPDTLEVVAAMLDAVVDHQQRRARTKE